MTAPAEPSLGRLDEAQFLAAVRQAMPADLALGPDTPLASLRATKVGAAALRRVLDQLLPGATDELLASIETLGEAHRWHVERSPEAGGPPPGPRVRLRPLIDADVPALHAAASSVEQGFRWRYRGATPSLAEFHRQLFDGVLAQYVVASIEDGVPHGMVCAYNARFDSQTVYLGFLRTSAAPGRGEVLEGMVQFIELLFRTWSFRKVYAEVPEFNARGLFDPASKAVRVEGRLTDHCWYDGRWWDQLIVALWREDWAAERSLRPAARG